MKNGICPKCGGREVYSQEGGKSVPGEGVILVESAWRANITRPDKYVCALCHYLEYYLPDPEDIQIIREKWHRVDPA